MKVAKAFVYSLFAVAYWGLTALLLTGEFNEAILAVAFALTTLAFLLLRRGVRTPELFWNGMTLIAFGVTIYVARSSLLDAAIYFFVYLLIAKLFTLKNAVDARWVYLVVFFQMVGAAVLTTSLGFAVIFAIYVALMACSTMLFTVCKEQEHMGLIKHAVYAAGSRRSAAESNETVLTERSALRGIVAVASFAAIIILACSTLFFVLIPRLSTQKLFQGYAKNQQQQAQAGFDEQIEFGAFGAINLDNAVAMYVRPGDNNLLDRPNYLRLRGVALDTFDGRRWKRSTPPISMNLRPAFAPFTRRLYTESRDYTIIQPPGVTNYLFGDSFPEHLRLPQEIPYLFDPLSNSAWLPAPLSKDLQYWVSSKVERLETRIDPDELHQGSPRGINAERFALRGHHVYSRSSRAVVTEEYLESCLSVPRVLNTDKLRDLSNDWTASADSPFRKARAIEERFRTEFGYSLEQKARGNYIEDFLFNVKEGHCEYFATSMAIMLRMVDIPSRVVNGYYSTEWNNIGNAFTVRQRDAHSWVEAYLGDDYGWMTFDPTPPMGVGRPVVQNAVILYMSRLVDAVKVRWYRYVIDYTFRDQIGVIRSALEAHQMMSSMVNTARFQFFGNEAKLFGQSLGPGILFGGLALLPLAVMAAFWLLWRLLSGRVRFKRRRTSETAIRFYRDILRLLAKHGYVRKPGQTPLEFARSVASGNPDFSTLPVITELYYINRFSNVEPSPEDLSEASKLLTLLKRYKPRQT